MRKMPNDVEKLDRISGSIDADGKGNAEVGKDLTIDGNLKFNSLVSDENPEGIFDPTGTGGGGSIALYCHLIELFKENVGYINFNYYTTKSQQFTFDTLVTELTDKKLICTGNINPDTNNFAMTISVYSGHFLVSCRSKTIIGSTNESIYYNSGYRLYDTISRVD